MTAAVALGLLTALLYGATDFLARFAGQAVGALRTICLGHGVAALGLGLLVWHQGVPHAPHWVWLVLAVSNVLGLAATICLYRALAAGAIAVVCPIVASYGGIAALLSAMAGEILPLLAWAGLGLAFAGGIVAAREGGRVGCGTAGRNAAIAAALLYGVSLWLQGQYVVPHLGAWVPVWCYYTLGFSLTLAWAVARKIPLAVPIRAAPLVIGTTALACGGTLALAAGQATGAIATVTVLSALASAVTVALARLLLKEAVSPAGWAGLAMIVSGLALLRGS